VPSKPSVTFDDLESALLWVSSGGPFENRALISKATGQVFYASSTHETEDELPEDIDDASLYWSVPHKNDLNLGRDLAFQFTAEYLPEKRSEVQDFFQRRGAYGRFRDLLERTERLEQWHQYEQVATRRVLLAWAAEVAMSVAAGTAN
jgi:hypothetical protein